MRLSNIRVKSSLRFDSIRKPGKQQLIQIKLIIQRNEESGESGDDDDDDVDGRNESRK